MQDVDDLVQSYAKNFMLEIMAVLWINGQTELHVGGMMRLMGVGDEVASLHDHERVPIDADFGRLLEGSPLAQALFPDRPKNQTLH